MKHRTIAAFAVIALLAATTAAAMRSTSSSANRAVAPAGMMSPGELAPDVNKLPTERFDSVQASEPGLKKAVRYEAVIANWKRHRSATKPDE
jgi:hypothetical protein